MILTKHKLTDVELEALGYELTMSSLDGTLTEQRYDELVELLMTEDIYPDAGIAIILDGKPAWRAKHVKRYNIQASFRTA
jgi:hypothetical protein